MTNKNPIIASFDIGIKNMAYCVVELDINTSPTCAKRILTWGIINMVPEVAQPPNCCCTIEKNVSRGSKKAAATAATATAAAPQPCTNISAYTCSGLYYCKKHIDKKRVITSKEFSSLKKKKIDSLREFCEKRAIVVDFTEKKLKIVENIEKILISNFYIPIIATNTKNAKEIDLICAGREMTRQLDNIFCSQQNPNLINQITHVFIENQISTLAVRMKTLQGMLTQYFIIRGGEQLTIKYISALKKLNSINDGHKTKTTYSERKKQGIELCGKLLRENKNVDVSNWIDFFENSRTKRDDLSDAFLQGVFGWICCDGAPKDIKK